MTLKEAAQQALEVLDDFVDDPRCQKQIDDVITALRQALANRLMDKVTM